MPTYVYLCQHCGPFEAYGHLDDREIDCDCGRLAERRPFSGVPYLKGETVSKAIPDPVYRQDAEHRDLKKQGWDLDRSIRHIRKGMREDNDGRRVYDPKLAAKE